ncbi:glycosyltransferase WbsX family protein [Ferribacterium limneticum]|uniref:glycosyltransferase WbsX family protein n=1 Tax=Ferribacterium limneticum TaxID=76259 RepID=UPI001CFB9696|nr:glycoside hydrolase family 99-like domain-containing protein [Ferribacterium limneticum]UCV29291.1 glycoside hydrolase family 99-like domain-containing protein [Ferribacterium limneticum]UCV33210.1 glycoside hydrolase family 99-like domain-containing protein [Ferribacterium limneticum]
MGAPPRLVAFFLPQFHPIAENDLWWGKGFTEWTNVTKASPLFDGHYQPHLPTDLGFYDLRVRETRSEQIRLAKEYGIDGFCYHYYWFSGTRLLSQPLDDMLADPESDFPFCLCWANENWTRRWDGAEHQILMSQRYLPDDDINFIHEISPYLADHRYIRVDGAPLLIVYFPQQLPRPTETTRRWREYCEKSGIGKIHLCAALTHGNQNYRDLGFDSGVEFPPHNVPVKSVHEQIRLHKPFSGRIFHYHEVAKTYLERKYEAPNVFRGVFPSWDNTARTSNRATMVLNGTPSNYEYWLASAIKRTQEDHPEGERLIFINAWNEWAEGCHLEPDRKYGRQFLEATLRAKNGLTTQNGFVDTSIPETAKRDHMPFFNELHALTLRHLLLLQQRIIEKTASALKRAPRLKRFLKKILFWI